MILIINCGSQKVSFIEEIVNETADFETVGMYDEYQNSIINYDGIIISGAPILITEVDYNKYLELFFWIKSYSKPILGICFGHQIIGLLFQAFPTRQKEDRDWQTISILEDCILFDKLPQEFEMMEDHCEAISVPKDFILCATSDACVNEAMKHKEKPTFGVQFHPEVSGNLGQIVVNNFLDYCLVNKNN